MWHGNWSIKARDATGITSAEMKYLDRRLVWLWWGILMPIGMPC
jgi:hypothetical protein